MEKELEITTPLDQSISIEHQDILEEVDETISLAVETRDVELAFGFCKRMIGNMKRSGIALAKALWMMSRSWDVFELGDDFIPTAQDYLGIHVHTIERYVKVWEMLENYVPISLRDEIQQKNIKSLIPIANAIAQGHELDNNTWEKIAEATDYQEVSKIVREDVKDQRPRKNSLVLKIDQRGSIWAYANNGVFFIGSLEVNDTNDVVKKGIERIIANSGILK